ncbi:clostripain-related cysteine peptidase [Parabacteroides sp. PF5-9]|uniref:clostripain-related cysteine peptidase n=1 Tax=Parabacteroides sp. PF5-9 TaxID=1742404 RepID=UPI0024742A14|nr:clostripain-related cysteine peptidase [Parabacteroides sp. PF5-9]MDH6356723.1 hypothetical protein [Parabacteroides sp. PF5-9]
MKIKNWIYFILFVLIFSSCIRDNDDDIIIKENGRTVLVYMVKSDLDYNGHLTNNINQMMAAVEAQGLNDGHLLIFSSENENRATLFEIKKAKDGKAIKDTIEVYSGKSGVDPETLTLAANRVFKLYPSEQKGLFFSSHGTSWLPTGYVNMLRAFGEENKRQMEINELRNALDNSGNFFDYIIFDACSMGGIECVYELRNNADYIISSPSEILAPGFPYDKIMPLCFKTNVDPSQIAWTFYEHYKTEYNSGKSPYANISVVKTSELENLASATKAILETVEETMIYDLPYQDIQVLSYLSRAPELYDIKDAITHLTQEQELLEPFNVALANTVVSSYTTDRSYSASSGSFDITTFSGLSIYTFREQHPQLNQWYKDNLSWYRTIYGE